MPKRSSFRLVLVWAGLLSCAVLVAAIAVSAFVEVLVRLGSGLHLFLGYGQMGVGRVPGFSAAGWAERRHPFRLAFGFDWLPIRAGGWYMVAPLWAPLVVIALMTFAVWRAGTVYAPWRGPLGLDLDRLRFSASRRMIGVRAWMLMALALLVGLFTSATNPAPAPTPANYYGQYRLNQKWSKWFLTGWQGVDDSLYDRVVYLSPDERTEPVELPAVLGWLGFESFCEQRSFVDVPRQTWPPPQRPLTASEAADIYLILADALAAQGGDPATVDRLRHREADVRFYWPNLHRDVLQVARLIALALAVAACWRMLVARKAELRAARVAAGLCPMCCYSMTGISSSTCPECGASVAGARPST